MEDREDIAKCSLRPLVPLISNLLPAHSLERHEGIATRHAVKVHTDWRLLWKSPANGVPCSSRSPRSGWTVTSSNVTADPDTRYAA